MIGVIQFLCFQCPSEMNRKSQLHLITLYLSNGEGRRLGHFSVGTEESVAFKGFILARRDEGKHAVVSCVRRAVRDPDNREFDS